MHGWVRQSSCQSNKGLKLSKFRDINGRRKFRVIDGQGPIAKPAAYVRIKAWLEENSWRTLFVGWVIWVILVAVSVGVR